MYALQQGRAVFNPLPLEENQSPDLVPKVQAIAEALYAKLVALGVYTADHQNSIQEEQCIEYLSRLNAQGAQGLLWSQDLEDRTSCYWEKRIEASKFPEH
jgi:hypothetical protein